MYSTITRAQAAQRRIRQREQEQRTRNLSAIRQVAEAARR